MTREVGLLCDADLARMERYEPEGTVTGVAVWGRVPAEPAMLAVGTRIDLDGVSIASGVKRTGGPVRVDDFGQDAGAIATEARALGSGPRWAARLWSGSAVGGDRGLTQERAAVPG